MSHPLLRQHRRTRKETTAVFLSLPDYYEPFEDPDHPFAMYEDPLLWLCVFGQSNSEEYAHIMEQH